MPWKKQRKGFEVHPDIELATLNVLVRDNWSDEIPLNKLPDKLLSIFRDYEQGKCGLNPSALNLYQRIKRRNGGVLPKMVGGRPLDKDWELRIAVEVTKAIAAQTGKRKNITKAIEHVSKKLFRSATTVRDIYYHHRADPELRRAVELSMKERELALTEPKPATEPVMVRSIPPEFYEAGLPPSRTELPEEEYQWWLYECDRAAERRARARRAAKMQISVPIVEQALVVMPDDDPVELTFAEKRQIEEEVRRKVRAEKRKRLREKHKTP
jgi:Mitochondrial ribosomal protein L37